MHKIVSPPNRVVYQRDQWYLYFDPTNLKWAKVNEDGKMILSEFESHPDYAEAIEHLKRKYEIDETTILQFINYMIDKAKYLHWDEYKPTLITFPPKSSIPKTLYLHPSYRCNLRCVYCYNSKERLLYTKNRSNTELSLDDYHLLFQNARQLGIKELVFTGGEPLLHKDIFEMARISKEMGFHTRIITNGTLITREKAVSMIRYFDLISVSIDSLNAAENDGMRGKNSYKRALRGIRYLRELNGKVSCLGVTHPGTINSVKASWEYFVKQLGCIAFIPQAYIPLGEANNDLPGLDEFVIKYGRIRSQMNYKNGTNGGIKLCNNCGICSGEIAIGADGNVFPCQSILKQEFCGGNIKTDSLQNILEQSQVFKRLREFTVDDFGGCQKCEVKYLCGGGCRAIHMNITGDFRENNRYHCSINKEIIINGMFEISNIPNVDKSPGKI